MYFSPRAAFIRNLAVAGLNGSITLIILLIAPMGLAGVIANTLMVTVASFFNATFIDRVALFLQGSTPNPQDAYLHASTPDTSLDPTRSNPIDRTSN
jgi:hypothetical protein